MPNSQYIYIYIYISFEVLVIVFDSEHRNYMQNLSLRQRHFTSFMKDPLKLLQKIATGHIKYKQQGKQSKSGHLGNMYRPL